MRERVYLTGAQCVSLCVKIAESTIIIIPPFLPTTSFPTQQAPTRLAAGPVSGGAGCWTWLGLPKIKLRPTWEIYKTPVVCSFNDSPVTKLITIALQLFCTN